LRAIGGIVSENLIGGKRVSDKNKYVLIIGKILGGPEFDVIKSMDYRTIIFNTKMKEEYALEADIALEIDLNCETSVINKVLEISKKYDIKAVYTLNEYRVPLCAKVREILGLKYGITFEAALNCRSKINTRNILKFLSKGSVQYKVIKSIDEAEEFVKEIGVPVVVKPSNEAGSNLVFCCKTVSEVKSAVDQIIKRSENCVGQKLDEDILIEEYLDGPEYSIETYTYKGVSKVIAFTEKKILAPFIPIEIGHTVPANLSLDQKREIEEIVVEALRLLKVDFTVAHIEIRLTLNGVKIIEVNARPGGDKIPHLVKATTGIDLYKAALRLSLGENIEKNCECDLVKKADVRFIIADKDGIVKYDNISFLDDNKSIKKVEIKINDGDKVKKTTSNYDRLGWFISYNEDDRYIDSIMKNINIRIN
jgi:biotin carboxylase